MLIWQLTFADGPQKSAPLKPGAIRCYSIVTRFKDHDVHNFFVLGYGKKGKALSGSAPHSNYLPGFEDSDLIVAAPQTLTNHISVFGQPTCWLVPSTYYSVYSYLHDWGAVIILYTIATLVAMAYFMEEDDSPTRKNWGRLLYVSCVVLGGYFLHQFSL